MHPEDWINSIEEKHFLLGPWGRGKGGTLNVLHVNTTIAFLCALAARFIYFFLVEYDSFKWKQKKPKQNSICRSYHFQLYTEIIADSTISSKSLSSLLALEEFTVTSHRS